MSESDVQIRKVSDIVFREDLYPRIKHDSALVQQYAENLEVMPPIEVNQNNILIDGFHRLTAHRKVEKEEIAVVVTETQSENELFALSIERNSKHGMQLNDQDKRKTAVRLYSAGTGLDKQRIAEVLSVTTRQVNNYLTTIDKNLAEQRNKTIFDMWLACHTQEEIAAAVDLAVGPVNEKIKKQCSDLETFPKQNKLLATFQDADFRQPLYNVWRYGECSNGTDHFGKSEQAIVDNLLYLYTDPFDIVVDPFAGGGSTIDVCSKRLRRYWVADRKPIPERENEIRKHDIVVDGVPPLNKNWGLVSLTYLDPPYWRQAEGRYSNDPTDLANMPLEEFTSNIVNLVKEIGRRQSKGAVALLIQPTQWKTEMQFTDHVFDIISGVGNKKLVLENRVSCPYNSEQYNPQMVNVAKRDKKLLVLTRELIIWSVKP